MYVGKTLFAQVIDFLPWTTFARLVIRYGGDHLVRTLSCAEQFRAMAFAQLTYRESLRDIEACLSAQASKRYHLGFRSKVALDLGRCERNARLAPVRRVRATADRPKPDGLYASDSLDVELSNTAYALDSTTIDLCLTMFPWAPFRGAKAAVKVHTLLDLRGAPEFCPHFPG